MIKEVSNNNEDLLNYGTDNLKKIFNFYKGKGLPAIKNIDW